ncbi:hypothetical protein [Curtobacterium sp. MCSS17_008]|uniref:hypothetical protein n=1 Tax=Curtobacterium sp. MCSS17_008 TaxID=2175647 RepID=UPI0015E8D3F5|nr:hypothetical protein [Curtobacterium sp. MCSS17_008]
MTATDVKIDWQLLHQVRERTGIDNDTEAVQAALTQFLTPPTGGKEDRLPTEEATSYWG